MAPMVVFRLTLDAAADVCFIQSNAGIQVLFDCISICLFSVKRCFVLIGVVGALEPLPAATGRSPVPHGPQTLFNQHMQMFAVEVHVNALLFTPLPSAASIMFAFLI